MLKFCTNTNWLLRFNYRIRIVILIFIVFANVDYCTVIVKMFSCKRNELHVCVQLH